MTAGRKTGNHPSGPTPGRERAGGRALAERDEDKGVRDERPRAEERWQGVRAPGGERAREGSKRARLSRRHTRYFLRWAAAASPVYLAADVDMTAVERHRAAARARGVRFSPVSYLLYVGGRVLARHPAANAAPAAFTPRTVRFGRVSAKLALDHRAGSERAVFTAVIPAPDILPLTRIQALVDRYRDGGPDAVPGARGVRLLGRLPAPLGELLFRAALARTGRRPELLGTFAVSTLGHRRVDAFASYGGTAVTLTAGRIAQRAVVRDGEVTTAPVLRLGLTFDHRVIDGAEAADILDGLVHLLEGWDADLPGGWDGLRHRDGDDAPDPGDRAGRALAAGPGLSAGSRQRRGARQAGRLAPRGFGRPRA